MAMPGKLNQLAGFNGHEQQIFFSVFKLEREKKVLVENKKQGRAFA